MPGLYGETDYDLAGTIIGVVEKSRIIDKRNVKPGDIVIGLASNGLHTNGYSLVRKVLLNRFKLTQRIAVIGGTLGEELMKVHRSYLKVIQAVTGRFRVSSISHITGGGILGNTIRVVPQNLNIKINWSAWQRNPIFGLIQKTGKISEKEMRKVFNLGIGLIFIVREKDVDGISKLLRSKKEKYYLIGEITKK
jgi:phosphoribosylformylglycinamidine cyclo-ligase